MCEQRRPGSRREDTWESAVWIEEPNSAVDSIDREIEVGPFSEDPIEQVFLDGLGIDNPEVEGLDISISRNDRLD